MMLDVINKLKRDRMFNDVDEHCGDVTQGTCQFNYLSASLCAHHYKCRVFSNKLFTTSS